MVKKEAFTLAEVLITLVIIGVVAALTIPNLMQKYQEQTTVKKVQKFNSNLANAYALAMKENGDVSDWGLTGQDTASAEKIYEMLFKPYFKITKNCGTTNEKKCVSGKNYKHLNNNIKGTYTTYYKVVLDDGATILWSATGPNDVGTDIYIGYDVNGIKEPNQWGRDLFFFGIRKNLSYPDGSPKKHSSSYFTNNCKTTGSGQGCTAWVVYKGNMDYLHCDDLSWTGKDKCK